MRRDAESTGRDWLPRRQRPERGWHRALASNRPVEGPDRSWGEYVCRIEADRPSGDSFLIAGSTDLRIPADPPPWVVRRGARELPASNCASFWGCMAQLVLMLAFFDAYRIETRSFRILVVLATAGAAGPLPGAVPLEEAALRGGLDPGDGPRQRPVHLRAAYWPSRRCS